MHKGKLLLTVLFLTALFALAAPNAAAAEDVPLTEEFFLDVGVRNYLSEHFDANGDGVLSEAERMEVKELDMTYVFIRDISWVRYFPNLETFICKNGDGGSVLDFSANTKLKKLLLMYFQQASVLDLSGCRELRELTFYCGRLTSLDLSACNQLEFVEISSNKLTSLTLGSQPNLTTLYVNGNQITDLDLSGFPKLTELYCQSNRLTRLRVDGCPMLSILDCNSNALAELDMSGCSALTELNCSQNALERLDVSDCPNLAELHCDHNSLIALDLSNNQNIQYAELYDNYRVVTAVDGVYDLSRLEGFDISRADFGDQPVNGTTVTVDWGCTYDYHYDTGTYLQPLFRISFQMSYTDTSSLLPVDEAHFPDAVFRDMVARSYDKDHDGLLNQKEVAAVTLFSANGMGFTSVEGIQYFTNLETVFLGGKMFEELDFSRCPRLKTLHCRESGLTSLDLSGCAELETLYCENNSLQSLDLSACANLRFLRCGNNQLTELILAPDAPLEELMCENNALSRLDLGSHPELIMLYCQENALRQLDVSGLPSLRDLRCGNNLLTFLDLSGNPGLQDLECEYNLLSSLDVSGLPTLGALICWGNQLKTLDLSGNTNLSSLNCAFNQLTCLDVSNIPHLVYLACNGNQYNVVLKDSSLNLRALPGFNPGKASGWSGGWVRNDSLYVNQSGTVTYQYEIARGVKAEFSMCVTLASALGTDIPIDETRFPDPMFRAYVTGFADADGNGTLSEAERDAVLILSVDEMNIASLEGLRYFSRLTMLTCSGNQLAGLDVRVLPDLTILFCDDNRLTSLDLSANAGLLGLSCRGNGLTQLDVSANQELQSLLCSGNRLTALDLSQCPALAAYIGENEYTEYGDYASFGGRNGSIQFDLGVTVIPAKPRRVLALSASLTEIGEEAFLGISAEAVIAPAGLKTIGPRAFADCPALKEVRLPDSVTQIADDAFAGSPNVVIISSGRAVQEWAQAHGVVWKAP